MDCNISHSATHRGDVCIYTVSLSSLYFPGLSPTCISIVVLFFFSICAGVVEVGCDHEAIGLIVPGLSSPLLSSIARPLPP